MYYVMRKDNEQIVAISYHAEYAAKIAESMGFECIIRFAEGFHR